MGELFQNSGHEEIAPDHGRMDEKANSHDLLETVETSEDAIQDASIVRNPSTESMGIREHKKELLEDIQ